MRRLRSSLMGGYTTAKSEDAVPCIWLLSTGVLSCGACPWPAAKSQMNATLVFVSLGQNRSLGSRLGFGRFPYTATYWAADRGETK